MKGLFWGDAGQLWAQLLGAGVRGYPEFASTEAPVDRIPEPVA